MPTTRYLTKSRFKLAMECETKLFYTKKKTEYADKSIDDPFLENLAQGGFQVGELAKYYYSDDPIKSQITIKSLDENEVLAETEKRLLDENVIIAEAAFKYENLFIRADIIQKNDKNLSLIEVKAKSYDKSDGDFFSRDRSKAKNISGVKSEWKEYLYDVAFQKYVITKAHPEYNVNAYLMLADKEVTASVDGLNQFFKIDNSEGFPKIISKPGLTQKDLGEKVLIEKPIDEIIKYIWEHPYTTVTGAQYSFEEYIKLVSDAYRSDVKIKNAVGTHCKKCQFVADEESIVNGFKSGRKECWKEQLNWEENDLKEPLVMDVWNLGKSKKLMQQGIYKMKEISYNDLLSNDGEDNEEEPNSGWSRIQRQWLQIEKVKNNDLSVSLDTAGLAKEMNEWEYPLHFIDFETCQVAIPFNKGRRPYEGIAFQYSHHVVAKDGTIKHAGQFIEIEPGIFPNYNFLRKLKSELDKDFGTIFKFAMHENTYLIHILDQLNYETLQTVPDKDELIDFIKLITHKKKKKFIWKGKRDIVDMCDLVKKYYYNPLTKGSNSIKAVLPSTLAVSPYLQEKYSKPIYGTDEIKSLNFKNWIWLDPAKGMNPYKSLPKLFAEYDEDALDELLEGFEEIAEGGAAQTAYAKLQFSEVPENQRQILINGLYKYCELDTMAMVMIWEYWNTNLEYDKIS